MELDLRDGGSRKVVHWSVVPKRPGCLDGLRIKEAIVPGSPSGVIDAVYFYRS